jgi:hypothetical protein
MRTIDFGMDSGIRCGCWDEAGYPRLVTWPLAPLTSFGAAERGAFASVIAVRNTGESMDCGSVIPDACVNRELILGCTIPRCRGELLAKLVTWDFAWAMQVSNLRPLPCEGSALPLS